MADISEMAFSSSGLLMAWQRLHHQPTRIVGVLDGYLCIFSALRLLALLVQEEFAQVEVLLALLMQGDRQGVHHEFTVAQTGR